LGFFNSILVQISYFLSHIVYLVVVDNKIA
jgi:hypothetical protein